MSAPPKSKVWWFFLILALTAIPGGIILAMMTGGSNEAAILIGVGFGSLILLGIVADIEKRRTLKAIAANFQKEGWDFYEDKASERVWHARGVHDGIKWQLETIDPPDTQHRKSGQRSYLSIASLGLPEGTLLLTHQIPMISSVSLLVHQSLDEYVEIEELLEIYQWGSKDFWKRYAVLASDSALLDRLTPQLQSIMMDTASLKRRGLNLDPRSGTTRGQIGVSGINFTTSGLIIKTGDIHSVRQVKAAIAFARKLSEAIGLGDE